MYIRNYVYLFLEVVVEIISYSCIRFNLFIRIRIYSLFLQYLLVRNNSKRVEHKLCLIFTQYISDSVSKSCFLFFFTFWLWIQLSSLKCKSAINHSITERMYKVIRCTRWNNIFSLTKHAFMKNMVKTDAAQENFVLVGDEGRWSEI